MDVFANLRQQAPRELMEFLDQLLVLFPEELKYRLKQVIDALPPEGDNMHRILELVRFQWRDIRSDEKVSIVVVGPSQTGKTSLVREITRAQVPSGEPIFSVVDAQGLEEFLGYGSRPAALEELPDADVILLVLDGRYGISDSTVQLQERLRGLQRPLLVVLSKMDLVGNRGQAVRSAQKTLGSNVFPLSLSEEGAVDKLLKAIVVTNPKTLYPLTRNFPGFRRTICDGVVTQSAFSAGVVGAIPIPVSDLLPITAIQTAMILKIARAFGHRLNRERARELLPMLGAGALVRELSHRLRQRFPHQKGLIAVSAAGLWTFALGRVAVSYFEKLSRYLESAEVESFQPLRMAEAG